MAQCTGSRARELPLRRPPSGLTHGCQCRRIGQLPDRRALIVRCRRPKAGARVGEEIIDRDAEGVCAVTHGAGAWLRSPVEDVPHALRGEPDVRRDFALKQVVHADQVAQVRTYRVLVHRLRSPSFGCRLTGRPGKGTFGTQQNQSTKGTTCTEYNFERSFWRW